MNLNGIIAKIGMDKVAHFGTDELIKQIEERI